MIRGEPDRPRVLAQVMKPERRILANQDAQNPPTPWELTDRSVCLGVDARGEEALELGAGAIDHPERCVSRTRELGRRLDEPLQKRINGQLGRDRDTSFDQRTQAIFAPSDRVHKPSVPRRGALSALSKLSTSYGVTVRRMPDGGKPSRRDDDPDESTSSRKETAMFKTIIWATDGSETADGALPFARALAESEGGRLIAVHSKEVFVGGRATGFPVLADEEELDLKIERQVNELRAGGLDATFKLISGMSSHASKMVADVARDFDADVIVVGTRGHGPLAGALVGSVTQQLLHIAPCPVLAVAPAKQVAKRSRKREHAATTV